MDFTGGYEPLPLDKQEEIKEAFAEFYRHYSEYALPGQVTFMDSLAEQFHTKKYLSDRQIEAMQNILNSCDEAKENNEEIY